MIIIKNRLKAYSVDKQRIQKRMRCLLDQMGYADFDITIWCTTNQTIRRYNREYRHIDRVTDILSFPFHYDVLAGNTIVAQSSDEKVLGDLIIAIPYVQVFCKKQQYDFDVWMDRLLVHGLCHLVGYDHMKEFDHKIMVAKERELLRLCHSPAEKIAD